MLQVVCKSNLRVSRTESEVPLKKEKIFQQLLPTRNSTQPKTKIIEWAWKQKRSWWMPIIFRDASQVPQLQVEPSPSTRQALPIPRIIGVLQIWIIGKQVKITWEKVWMKVKRGTPKIELASKSFRPMRRWSRDVPQERLFKLMKFSSIPLELVKATTYSTKSKVTFKVY